MTELLITLLFTILPPCPTEDSVMCAWDAQSQGNGVGTSFISLTEDTALEVSQ